VYLLMCNISQSFPPSSVLPPESLQFFLKLWSPSAARRGHSLRRLFSVEVSNGVASGDDR
jgi:hypothetical protein